MYIIRDIFHLKFGQYRQVKPLLDEFVNIYPSGKARNFRVLTDFTGKSYRVIMEETFPALADFEKALNEELSAPEFQEWYAKFKPHIDTSYREILKQVK